MEGLFRSSKVANKSMKIVPHEHIKKFVLLLT